LRPLQALQERIAHRLRRIGAEIISCKPAWLAERLQAVGLRYLDGFSKEIGQDWTPTDD
jgi:hypothetical protein